MWIRQQINGLDTPQLVRVPSEHDAVTGVTKQIEHLLEILPAFSPVAQIGRTGEDYGPVLRDFEAPSCLGSFPGRK